LSGFLLWAVVLIICALIAFRVGPPYMEFLTIQSQLKAVANDPEGRNGARNTVTDLFDRRAAIENIKAVSGRDIQIVKEGDRAVLSVEYSVCVPLVLNIRVCMDYSASSK
jgi:hypothetical protein